MDLVLVLEIFLYRYVRLVRVQDCVYPLLYSIVYVLYNDKI